MLHTMYILSDLLSSAMASDHAESLTKNVQNSAGACRILQELRNSSSKTLKKCKFRAKFKLEKAQKMPISRNLGSKKLKKCKFRHKKYNFWLFSRNFRNFAWRGLRAWLEGVAWQKSCKILAKMLKKWLYFLEFWQKMVQT